MLSTARARLCCLAAAALACFACGSHLRVQAPPVWTEQPVRGWNSWNAYGCTVNETVMRQTADFMVLRGLAAAGYKLVAPDDCWAASRTASGDIVEDPVCFPSGMERLADYVRMLGLEFGIYTAIGFTTCAGRPGSAGYEANDAATYARWGVKWAKIDNCNYTIDPAVYYLAWADAMDSLPYRIPVATKAVVNYTMALTVAASRRVGTDISPNWRSMITLAYMGEPLWRQARLGDPATGQSSFWTDLELLEVGNKGLTWNETQTHFLLWCAMHAPLMLSTVVEKMTEDEVALITNPEALAINHDPLGAQARRVALKPEAHPQLPLLPASIACSNGELPQKGGSPHLIAPGQAWEFLPVFGTWSQFSLTKNAGPSAGLCLQQPACDGNITVDACPQDISESCMGGLGTLWRFTDGGGLESALGDCVQLDSPRVRMMPCVNKPSDQSLVFVKSTGQLLNNITTPGQDYIGYPICLDALPFTHTEVWAAPLANGDLSVFLLNPINGTHYVAANFTEISHALGLSRGTFSEAKEVRDIGQRRSLGPAGPEPFSMLLPPHASALLRVTPQW